MDLKNDRERKLSGKRTRSESEPEVREAREKLSAGKIVRNIFLVLLVLCLLAAAGVYIAGMRYFKDRFFWNTTVNGFNVSEQTVEEVEDMIAARIATYKLEIAERGGDTETITSDEIKYHFVSKGETQAFLDSQKTYLWPKYYWDSISYTFDSSAQHDEELLLQRIDDLNCFDPEYVVEPKDAYIDFVDGTYQVMPEVEGNKLKKKTVTKLITEAVDFANVKLDLEEEECYREPSKRQDDSTMNETCEVLNTCLETDLVYLFGDNSVRLDAKVIHPWLSYEEDGTVNLDGDAVREFVRQMADKYDTAYKPREFVTHDGYTTTVEGGQYGWIMDQEATYDYMVDAIWAGNTGETYAEFAQTAVSWYNSDLGDSYVEINLGAQHVWLYIDGEEIVSTDCVSGTASDPSRITPSGTYTLYYKESPSVLKGENNEYESKVTYWMPFNGGIGLHDASWRNSFGGDIYKSNGSHGCINLPVSAAAAIYANVYDGIPIICYY